MDALATVEENNGAKAVDCEAATAPSNMDVIISSIAVSDDSNVNNSFGELDGEINGESEALEYTKSSESSRPGIAPLDNEDLATTGNDLHRTLDEPTEQIATGSSAMSLLADQQKLNLSVSKAVTAERKQQLILEARESRKRWIAKVSTPYRVLQRGDPSDVLRSLRQTYAFSNLPSAAKLLDELYECEATQNPEQLVKHIGSLIDDRDRELAFPTGREILTTQLSISKDAYLLAYAQFWKSLHDPACSMIVQNMRNACLQLKLTRSEASVVLNSMTASIYAIVRQHVVFKQHDQVKRCLEAFLIGQCYERIVALFTNPQSEQAELDFQERLDKLQFLTPRHLDATVGDIDLSKPILAIKTVDKYHSVYDKLQRALALYQGINEALSAALQVGGITKPPSADDVLPTIIYTLIQAKPENILINLQMIEELARPEDLRGEAGYAFTNLYGAVQFLIELDLQQPLNMSSSEWKDGIGRCASAVSRREQKLSLGERYAPMNHAVPVIIPPSDIREARERGEVIDVEWARRWQEDHKIRNTEDGVTGETVSLSSNKHNFLGIEQVVLEGFTRSYAYLGTRPEDLRLVDMEPLLGEYKMLVQATETLLGDQMRLQRQQRQMEQFAVRNVLYRDMHLTGDSSLLEKESNV
jgi:hypothetical protein